MEMQPHKDDSGFIYRPDSLAIKTKTICYLVRHGVTAANKQDRFAGRSNEPLHSEGVCQMQAVAAKLTSSGINRIYCGPLPRTRQSAETIATLLGVPVACREGLNEIFLPHWDGLTKEQITRNFGQEYPTWLSDPANFQVQGCETIGDVQKRAVACLEEIVAENPGKKILIVSHLITLRSLALFYQNRPLNDFRSIKVENAAVLCLTCDGQEKSLTFPA
jgi:probable phosphoglycerate mutase